MRQILWAALRDAQGAEIPSSDPIASLIAAYPALRALPPAELARELEITEDEASRAIATLADAIYGELARRDPRASLDELTIENGTPAPPVWMAAAATPAGQRTSPRPLVRTLELDDARGLEAGDLAQVPQALRGNSERGVVCVGYSYTMGQDALHAPMRADPNDPDWPHPDDFAAFWRGITRCQPSWSGEYADYSPTFTAPWLKGDVTAWVRACWRSFKNYGPIPIDDADTSYRWNWDPDLAIKAERHVFWYQFAPDADDADPGQLCMQIQGWSETAGAWLIGHDAGERVYAFHYRGNGEWRHVFDLGQWFKENWKQILAYTAAACAIAASVATVGVAAAATLPAAASATAAATTAATATTVTTSGLLAAAGTSLSLVASLETAIAAALGISTQALASILGGVAVAAVVLEAAANIAIAAVEGNAAGVLYAIKSLWGAVQSVAGPEVQAWLKGAESDAQRAAKDFFAPMGNLISNFQLDRTAYAMAGSFSFSEIASAINSDPRYRKAFPPIDDAYIKSASAQFGAVGSYFFQAAQNRTAAELEQVRASVPQWAAEYFAAGAAVNLINAAQNAEIEAYAKKQASFSQLSPSVKSQGAQITKAIARVTLPINIVKGQPFTTPVFRQIEPPTPTPGPNKAPPPDTGETPSMGSAAVVLGAAALAYLALARK